MKKEKDKEKREEKIESENRITNQEVDENPEDNQEQVVDAGDKKIIDLQNELNEYKDRLLRKAAEFENFKRRTETDQLNLLKYSAESFITKLLPVIDDFERSIQYINTSNDTKAVNEGILLVYEKLRKVLEDQGVKKIKAVGKPFDVHFHEAMMQRTVEDALPHTVVDEIESGYMYKDRVIRHSKVIVSDDGSGTKIKVEE